MRRSAADPFADAQHSELVGVAFLYLDALQVHLPPSLSPHIAAFVIHLLRCWLSVCLNQYVLDVDEPALSVCSAQGARIGTIGVKIRCYPQRSPCHGS